MDRFENEVFSEIVLFGNQKNSEPVGSSDCGCIDCDGNQCYDCGG